MNSGEKERMAELAIIIDRETKHKLPIDLLAKDIARLVKIALHLDKINNIHAERDLQLTESRSQERYIGEATKIINTWGFDYEFNGSPEGYAIKLYLPSGASNTWGGKENGWGIG